MEKDRYNSIALEDSSEAQDLFGQQDVYLRLIEENFNTKIVARGCSVEVIGNNQDSEQVLRVFAELLSLLRSGYNINTDDVKYAIRMIKGGKDLDLDEIASEGIHVFSNRIIRPKTKGQKQYVASMQKHDLVFGIGPAGTGKTYLAMAMAVSALKKGEVGRIILTRPAVEAGERLGFLPGDILAKVDPYLRPLYDALYDMMPIDKIEAFMERSVIEVAPLAFMRGRTLNNSFVILDEAQNSTSEQMKMFLTRLGFDSKAVVTGDITQVDLPYEKKSGLLEVQTILAGIDGIKFSYLTSEDVVRHELVQKIIEAYELAKSIGRI
ncbi:MAG: phosphate starvation-inducible protein PhoH [Candidatus Poribacteria bacterium]|nr:phosphate starvation-inducible protein PhoH [Candidatus Poribacteria bacterium]